MKMLRKVPLSALAAVAALLLAPACGTRRSSSGAGAAAKAAQKWQCPMHPQIVRDAPGDCPICGMKLVPIEAETHPAAQAPTPSAAEDGVGA